MVNSLLLRKEQYDADQKRKKALFARAAASVCCVCLVSLVGVGIGLSGALNLNSPGESAGPEQDGGDLREDFDGVYAGNYWVSDDTADSHSEESEQDAPTQAESQGDTTAPYNPNTMTGDIIGVVILDGVQYTQFDAGLKAEAFTLDTYLGPVSDYEGTYQHISGVTGKLYTVVEDENILVVKLSNGGTVALVADYRRFE